MQGRRLLRGMIEREAQATAREPQALKVSG
jgi:hypothetical protein